MAYFITKTILYLVIPPASLIILIVAGFIILLRFHRAAGKIMIASGLTLFYLLSISPVSNALLKPLETSEPPLEKGPYQADAIVVLGGGVNDLSRLAQPTDPSQASLARLIKGITLYRALHLPLVLMGGNGSPAGAVEPDADSLQRTAAALGVPAKDIILENSSRNTIEGARSLQRLIPGKRIILVTSAYHIKRAAALFRKNGFVVTPAPAGYISDRRSVSLFSFIPRANSLSNSSTACSEYLSLLWYSMRREL
jgi:uncharacterized SAM-binding protein YcdF (DUF218 family)